VIASWFALLAIEQYVVARAFHEQFVGPWEMVHARAYVMPIALAAALPCSLVVVALARLVDARQVGIVAAAAAASGAAVGVGVSHGRHFQNVPVRVAFILLVVCIAALAGAMVVRGWSRARERAVAVALGAAGVSVVAWCADAFLLPRLYPAFHDGCFAALLLGTAVLTTCLPTRWRRLGLLGVLASCAALAFLGRSARALALEDNLRRVLLEHAPIEGRAVVLASFIAKPAPLDDAAFNESTKDAIARAPSHNRAIDWTGHDVVLLTVDALRADHVSAYGYPRRTTPNIDRLAARGARFDHAYCPTPHTSYSVTSLMTGKYMRPLLAMGLSGDAGDSETWATSLRRYGFRTGAFYPPAVFFIDEHRFRQMHESGLGFEYRKEEFAPPALRREQVESYVANAPADKPLFLWVHLFEPHEPYVLHPEHAFDGDRPVDAYDSEIAAADEAIGEIVAIVEQRRHDAAFIVTADHGEEFADHGGQYHGTTVYEEQVRVPLVIVGPGIAPRVVSTPVQTIDLLPTTLRALDIPQPARVRGRDLGPELAGTAAQDEAGLAFAETDEYTLLARGDDRLICVRKIASCTLFDVRTDPLEKKPVVNQSARVASMRGWTAAIERENGRLEAPSMPEALRRGLQGDREAAEEVATLLDDARVGIRREAARCAFKLHAPSMIAQVARALARDEDEQTKRWCSLALVRSGGQSHDVLVTDAWRTEADSALKLAWALTLAEAGDARGQSELIARWEAAFTPGASAPGELEEARELLAAMSKIRARAAVPALVRSLDDVRLRAHVVVTLGEIGDPKALASLLLAFANERYIDARPKEARALHLLGARGAMLAPLRRFAGVPEPMANAVEIARLAGLLVPKEGGAVRNHPAAVALDADVTVPGEGPARLLVETDANPVGEAVVAGTKVTLEPYAGQEGQGLATVELPQLPTHFHVHVDHAAAFWVVRRVPEIPPPAPKPWSPPKSPL
jgi:hypothetical protein